VVLIDPTIILTSGAADAPLLQISRMVTITTDAWKGVASSGMQWSYDAEASAVSDDTPTFAQPQVPVYTARGFIPYSIELGMDYPGFADEMSMLLGQGFLDLVARGTMVGSGSACPTGIFTSLANNTTNPAHVVVTTVGALGAVDVRTAWAALPERYRPRATWVMSPGVMSKVRAFGNGLALSDFTVNLLADGTENLTGRPVVVSDYAPSGDASATMRPHTVPLDCTADGGDMRAPADASVQPGVIVADSTFPPTTYSAESIDSAGNLEPIGAISTFDTTDHLVSAWQDSTNCFGSSISRNAWVADSRESDFSGPPADNFGDMSGKHLNQPMVGMSPTSDGQGYWLVAADGGIFTFGDAPFYGSTGNLRLNKPIEAMIPTPDGLGYWMVASDGGIFTFGDATFHGSLGGRTLSAPIAGMIPNGAGYTLIGQDGQEYPFT
jgi:hypothetical protein